MRGSMAEDIRQELCPVRGWEGEKSMETGRGGGGGGGGGGGRKVLLDVCLQVRNKNCTVCRTS